MSLINCGECGAHISEQATVCPRCGCPVNRQIPVYPSINPPYNAAIQKSLISIRSHPFAFFKTWLFVAVFLLFAILINMVAGMAEAPMFSLIGWIPFGLIVFLGIIETISLGMMHIEMTPERIIGRSGLSSTKSIDVPLQNVTEMKVSNVDVIFKFATLSITVVNNTGSLSTYKF